MISLAQPVPNIKSQRKAALSRHPELAGIDYIEVRQHPQNRWNLLLHFVPAAPEAAGKPALPPGLLNITSLSGVGMERPTLVSTPDLGIQVLSP
jgi:hypothetical protein